MTIVRREAAWEYLRGAFWVMPTVAVLIALALGKALASVDVSADAAFVFQGTPDDARTLLITITGTLATVIALVLGLTVVALQLASTQFSPRLLRNFMRDRVNQVVLSVFVASFTYSTAGLFTVGVSAGERVEDYPRLAVSFALVLLFVSLLMLVFFVHHLAHSIQIDEVQRKVELSTLRVIEHDLPTEGVSDDPEPEPPEGAMAVPAYRSGYVQTLHPEFVLPIAEERDLVVLGTRMVGEYVVEGSPLLWVWAAARVRNRLMSNRCGGWCTEWSGSASSALPSRTWRSECASSPTSRSRRSPRRSMTPTPPSSLSSTWASSSRRSPDDGWATSSFPMRRVCGGCSSPAGTWPTSWIWRPVRSAGTAVPSRAWTAPSCECWRTPVPSA